MVKLFLTPEEKLAKQREKELKDFETFIKEYQKDVPEQYNPCELLDYLTDEDIDHLMSISNRTDGKSFGYIKFFVMMAWQYGIGFTLVARHFELRYAYNSFLMEIVSESPELEIEKLHFSRTDDYIIVIYDGKPIGIITDLNNATDLKYSSNYLKKFPVMVYDEFLAIESDYLPDEWERLHLIYTSIDRNESIKFIKHPKIFFLGNAENFASPVLSNLDLFDVLETHKINTNKKYGNVALEMRQNHNANERRNTRAFNDKDDALTTGQFKTNKFNVMSREDYKHLTSGLKYFYIKIGSKMYIKVDYDKKYNEYIICLSVVTQNNIKEKYCLDLKDKTDDNTFLSDNYHGDTHYKYYENARYHFSNVYSKEFVTSHHNLTSIKIMRCIGEFEAQYHKLDKHVLREHKLECELHEARLNRIRDNFLQEFRL